MPKRTKTTSPKERTFASNFDMNKLAKRFGEEAKRQIDAMFEIIQTDSEIRERLSTDESLRMALAAYATRAVTAHGDRRGHSELDAIERRFVSNIRYDYESAILKPRITGEIPDANAYWTANDAAHLATGMTADQLVEFMKKAYDAAVKKMKRNIELGMPSLEFLPMIWRDKEEILREFDELTAVPTEPTDRELRDFNAMMALGLSRMATPHVLGYTMPLAFRWGEGAASNVLTNPLTRLHELFVRKQNDKLDDRATQTTDVEELTKAALKITIFDEHELQTAVNAMHKAFMYRETLERASDAEHEKLELRRRVESLEKQLKDANAAASSNQSDEGVKTEIDRLKRELDRERRRAERLQRENSNLSEKLAEKPAAESQSQVNALRAQIERLTSELDDLVHIVTTEDGDADDEPASLDTAPLDGMNVLVIGGVPIFVQEMSALHPAIRCFEQRVPPDETFDRADMVWLQIANLSHSVSDTIMAKCRQKGIPVHFFAQKGINRSKQQLVNEIREFVGD